MHDAVQGLPFEQMLAIAVIIEEREAILWVETNEIVAIEGANGLAVNDGRAIEVLFYLIFVGGFGVYAVINYGVVGRHQPRPIAGLDGIGRNIDAETTIRDITAVHCVVFHTIEGRNQRVVKGVFSVLVVGIYTHSEAIVEE